MNTKKEWFPDFKQRTSKNCISKIKVIHPIFSSPFIISNKPFEGTDLRRHGSEYKKYNF